MKYHRYSLDESHWGIKTIDDYLESMEKRILSRVFDVIVKKMNDVELGLFYVRRRRKKKKNY